MTERVTITKTMIEHYDALTPGDQHLDELVTKNLNALTFFHNGQVIAIIGGFFLSPGVMQVWSYISDKVKTCGISFYKKVMQVCKIYLNEPDIHRLQFSVKTSYKHGWKWGHALGFSCEGVMKDYGGFGKDYWLFARVKDGRT